MAFFMSLELASLFFMCNPGKQKNPCCCLKHFPLSLGITVTTSKMKPTDYTKELLHNIIYC